MTERFSLHRMDQSMLIPNIKVTFQGTQFVQRCEKKRRKRRFLCFPLKDQKIRPVLYCAGAEEGKRLGKGRRCHNRRSCVEAVTIELMTTDNFPLDNGDVRISSNVAITLPVFRLNPNLWKKPLTPSGNYEKNA